MVKQVVRPKALANRIEPSWCEYNLRIAVQRSCRIAATLEASVDGSSLPHSRGEFADGVAADEKPPGREFGQPSRHSMTAYGWLAGAVILAAVAITAISGHLLAGVLILAGTGALLGAAVAWGSWILDNTISL